MQTLDSPNDTQSKQRVEQVLARLRRKQLDSAISGNVSDSAKYADRAWRVRLLGGRAA